ncbi:thioredoxin [Cryptococcus floricola]|uniref:Thioredoxin n=1 Tax=Cryptococcus floricola TaxID=2591691 RepID=A0A5D3B3J7_9TREE|nr:thioredoxin [Cryptococcus floricola]
MIENITSLEEFKDLINGSDVVVIYFWAPWCVPCIVISPIFESLEGLYPGVKFHMVDVGEQPDIAQEAGIRAMPTFIAFKGGQKVDKYVGAGFADLNELIDKVSKL